MQTHLSDAMFWIAICQWIVAFPIGHFATKFVPRQLPVPLQAILVSAVMLTVVGAVFTLPLMVTGNLPLPCCDSFDSYKYGSGVGIALVIVARLFLLTPK